MTIYTVKVSDFGDKFWYQDGKRHRIDGPAVEDADGSKHWYQDGKLHRTDGPAVAWFDGIKRWYLNGKELTEAKWREAVKPKQSCAGEIVEVDGVKYRLVEA